MTTTTAVDDPDPLCRLCRRHPATVFGLCIRCVPQADWLIDPIWTD